MDDSHKMQVVTYLHSRFHNLVLGARLPNDHDVEEAFDEALTLVERSLSSGMNTIRGSSARPQLERLEQELKLQRERVREQGAVDSDWFQKTVSWLAEWVPDTELTLIAALGRIVRAAPPTPS
jgi:hypothetical protein